MPSAPGVFILTLLLLGVILLVGLSSLSTIATISSAPPNYAGIGLVFAALVGIVFFATRRHRR